MTLDPHKQFSEKNHTICQQIFDGLIRFGPEGKIEPALAVSWERLDENRMRFRLRREVKFHNGEDFDSGAVKFSIERYL
ncbi:MAG: peptide ABC transporter substrate-binding protein, partial [Elusimicrobia bacterium CG08_land_8_20_14_0_20_51_18]